MTWVSLALELDACHAEALSERLLESGALSVATEDAAAGTPAERACFDEPGEESCAWTRVRLNMLAQDENSGRALLARACADADLELPNELCVTFVDEVDWVRATQAQFAPIRISEKLWIVPSWHEPPDPAAINLILDPGRAFGTGSHSTTQLCLEWIEQEVRAGQTLLDYGCGSGILAIAAKKLGANRSVGVDIDALALEAARANATANGVVCEFADAGAPLSIKANLLVANILANPLILLAPALAGCTIAGGRIALSGILKSQAEEVAQVYRQWFKIDPLAEKEGWVRVSGTRFGDA
jgi:ribosomal protein L11 methyltransferase